MRWAHFHGPENGRRSKYATGSTGLVDAAVSATLPAMRTNTLLRAAVVAACLPVAAASAGQQSLGIVGNVRYHQTHTAVREWPFDKGDLSYGASLLIYDGMGYIELGCNYAPDPTADEVLDEVITPFARLVIEDRCVTAGIGVRDNYVTFTDDERDAEWTDLLYEFHLGLEFTLGPVVLGGGAYYSFDDWDDLKDFDVDDLEYGIHAGFSF